MGATEKSVYPYSITNCEWHIAILLSQYKL